MFNCCCGTGVGGVSEPTMAATGQDNNAVVFVINDNDDGGGGGKGQQEAAGNIDQSDNGGMMDVIEETDEPNDDGEAETSEKEKENAINQEKEQDTDETKDANETTTEAFNHGSSLFPIHDTATNENGNPAHLSAPDLRKAELDGNMDDMAKRHMTSVFLGSSGQRKTSQVAAVLAQPRAPLVVDPNPADLEYPAKEAAVDDGDKDKAEEAVNVATAPGGESDNGVVATGGDTTEPAASQDPTLLSPGTVMFSAAAGGAVDTGLGEGDWGEEDGPRRMSLSPRLMCPPGLEVLKNRAMVVVRQQMEADIKEGCGSPNSYLIWDINDEQLFFAGEASSCFCRWFCGPGRAFTLELFSVQEDLVLSLHRSCCRCDCCCCLDCLMCLHKLYVADCLGRTIGAIKQKFSVFSAKFDILDHDDNVLFKIRGPHCACRCSTEMYFQIQDKAGRQIGGIHKKWGGDRPDNVNVDHEYFDIKFPVWMENVDKALLIAAGFLVNYMYFEMS